MDSLVNFCSFIANHPKQVPSICGVLMSAGYLTPLNKLNQQEREERKLAGLPSKIRPINSGTMIAKVILSTVLHTPAADRARKQTEPFQLSMGETRGVEKLVHIGRAAYTQGYLIGRNDYANGFNSMSRQKMLDTHASVFPEAVDVFNLFYGCKAPAFATNANKDIVQIWSDEGSRQGCAAGCETFCVGISPVPKNLQTKFPEFEIKLVVDDIVPIIPPPASKRFEDWQLTYVRYASFLTEELAGLKLNLDKAGLLLPKDAPAPTKEVKALFDKDFRFYTEGVRIAGAPIGTDAFIKKYVANQLLETLV